MRGGIAGVELVVMIEGREEIRPETTTRSRAGKTGWTDRQRPVAGPKQRKLEGPQLAVLYSARYLGSQGTVR